MSTRNGPGRCPPRRRARARPVSGRAIVLGDCITTDAIIAGKYCRTADPGRLASHALEGLIADLAGKEKGAGKGKKGGGAVLVAGQNFGCGSSREQAPLALRAAGVKAVVAGSFGRIFFRNAINLGLPVLKCPGAVAAVQDGENVTVDVAGGVLRFGGGRRALCGERLPPFLMEVLGDGGLVSHIRRRFESGKA